MTSSEYDAFRPPEPPRRKRRGAGARGGGGRGGGRGGGGAARRAAEGGAEMSMVPEAEFASSYYGEPIVKAPPWGEEVAAYLFLGGLAGGSGLLAAGAQLTGRATLRRNARLTALGAVGLGGVALVKDLGRPERFYNMLRTFKVTSPMSVGSWILSAFSGGLGVAAVADLDRLLGERLPLGPLRGLLRLAEGPAGLAAAVFAGPLASYTAVLLSDTATPTWNATRDQLPFVFVSSASLAAAGAAMVTTPTDETGPARALAVLGVVGDVGATRWMEHATDPVAAEPLHEGRPGRRLRLAERLAIAGGLGAALGGGRRTVAAGSGLCLLAASALTRFGVFEAGLESTKDPRYVTEPQRRRLARRRAAGTTDDSITTA